MNNNEISNPKTEVEKGLVLTDKDYLESVLTVCKDLEKNLVIAMIEASHEEYYEKIHEMFESIAELQRDAYELYFRKGWFVIEKEDNEKLTKKYNMLQQELTDLGIDD